MYSIEKFSFVVKVLTCSCFGLKFTPLVLYAALKPTICNFNCALATEDNARKMVVIAIVINFRVT